MDIACSAPRLPQDNQTRITNVIALLSSAKALRKMGPLGLERSFIGFAKPVVLAHPHLTSRSNRKSSSGAEALGSARLSPRLICRKSRVGLRSRYFGQRTPKDFATNLRVARHRASLGLAFAWGAFVRFCSVNAALQSPYRFKSSSRVIALETDGRSPFLIGEAKPLGNQGLALSPSSVPWLWS